MKTKHVARVVFAVVVVFAGSLVVWFLKSPPGPSNPVIARDLIQGVVPPSWQIVVATEGQIEMTKEYFPDPRVQTLALVGPQVDHLRWRDHQGHGHVEDWSKECLLLWMVPSNFKPKFPNFFDHLAGGEILPTCIFSSEHVCVYGYVTNSGFDINRFRAMDKDIAEFSGDNVEPTWTNWATDIEAKLASVGNNNGTL